MEIQPADLNQLENQMIQKVTDGCHYIQAWVDIYAKQQAQGAVPSGAGGNTPEIDKKILELQENV